MIFVTVTTSFIINPRGECLSSDDKSSKLIRSTAASTVCDLFTFTANNMLKNFNTSKCVYNSSGRYLKLSQNCDEINSVFQQTPTGQLMQVNSEKCIAAVSGSSGTVQFNVSSDAVLSDVMLGNCDSGDKSLFRIVQGKRRDMIKLLNIIVFNRLPLCFNLISMGAGGQSTPSCFSSISQRDFHLKFDDCSHLQMGQKLRAKS